jgi:hypothetical protein
MHVDALAVGVRPERFRWANLAPRFAQLRGNYATGADLRLAQLFRTSDPLKKGVHLHFTLPAALTHGGESNDLRFPRIPNRWLVQRYDFDTGRLSKAWVVRSDDAASDSAGAVTVLMFPPADSSYDTPLTVRPTGVARVLFDGARVVGSVLEANTRAAVELTAVTGGDAGFAAHYPACRSMLGLYDDMAAVSGGTRLSYVVSGWYSSADDDPWHQLVTDAAALNDPQAARSRVDRWLADHRCARTFTELAALPSQLLCHGVVSGVPWNDVCDYSTVKPFNNDHPLGRAFNPPPFAGFTNLNAYTIDVGNNAAEAISSVVAGPTSYEDLVEDVLTGIQTGAVAEDAAQGTDPIDAAAMDEDIHRRGFAAVVGGTTWALRPVESALPGGDEARAHQVPAYLQDLLDALDAAQAVCNRYAQLQTDYRRELYALWQRWTAALIDDGPADLLRTNLDGLRTLLATFDGLPDVAAATKHRDEAKAALENALDERSDGGAREYTLEPSSGAPFHLPADPVLLVSGPAMQPLGTERQQGAVRCRVSGEEIRGYTFDEPNGAVGITATAESCMEGRVPREYLDAIPAASRALLGEAILLDDVQRLDPQTRRLSTDHPFAGVAPDDIGLFRWYHNPWLPLYLAWEVQWRSDYDPAALGSNAITARWGLHDRSALDGSQYAARTDLVLPDAAPAATAAVTASYSGFSLLQAVAPRRPQGSQAAPTLAALMGQALGDRLQDGDRPMMAQMAGGFHDALIMRRVGDQLPPLDFTRCAADRNRPLYLDRIADDLGSAAFDSSPMTNRPFLPLRSGAMKVRRLWIVDAFGQTIWLDPPPPVRHASRLAAAKPDADGFVALRPRFSQPMRLSFATVPGDDTQQIGSASKPVCGWIVPNHLEQSLTLYAVDGTPAGVLQRRFRPVIGSGEQAFYWVDVPGHEVFRAGGAPPEGGIENRHLRDFARYVLSLDADQGPAFAQLVDQAISSTAERMPEDDPGVSLLVGRPLALVRAALQLEMPGLPALDQNTSWKTPGHVVERLTASLTGTPAGEADSPLQTGGIERVRCPVRLGDRRTPHDGLVGCFIGDPAAALRPFYASWGFAPGDVRDAHVLATQDEAPALAVDSVSPLVVTLLMDPQASVLATTGAVPRVRLTLRAAEAAGAQRAREVFFQTAPVLGAPAAPQIPTPSDDYGEWSWAYRPDVTLWAVDPALVTATDRAGFSVPYPTISEGWLTLKIASVRILSLWVKNGAEKPKKGTDVWLAWSVHGADTLRLDTIVGSSVTRVREWSDAPLGRDIMVSVDQRTTYELVATDRSGNEDRKRITIEVE